MTRLVVSLLAALGLTAGAPRAADPPSQAARPAMTALSTEEFLINASAGNLFEIDSGKLALTKARSAQVRNFANKMVTDHTVAAIEFKKALAATKLTTPPGTLDARRHATVDNLKAKAGAAFDKAYIEAQYQAHVESLEMMQAYAEKGDNARMRQFAKDRLPTLRMHLDLAAKLRGKI